MTLRHSQRKLRNFLIEKQYHASQILLAFLTKWVPLTGLVILFFILIQIVYKHRF